MSLSKLIIALVLVVISPIRTSASTNGSSSAHIVLVHGSSHGAWCWFKVKPLLEAAGHRVTALDMAASGIDLRKLQDLRSFDNYTQPLLELMAALPPEEKVVLVGHSLGGLNLAFAMDMYPDKISVAVFLTAYMPDSINAPSYVIEQFNERVPTDYLDSEFVPFGTAEHPLTALVLGPKFLAETLYTRTSPQDFALALTLVRPGSLFTQDLAKRSPFSKERYGSVKRVFIVCVEDMLFPVDFVRWQIETIGAAEVKEIKKADHMAMLSTPIELFNVLLEITANN